MKGSIKKKLICFAAILAYSAGALFTPTLADGTDSFLNLDVLLEQRQETAEKTEQVTPPKQTAAEDFTDISENDWFYPYLEYLVSQNLIKGVTQTEFVPDGNFSYAECSTVITRYLGLEEEAARYKTKLEKDYGIKSTIWYSGYFQVMKSLGLFSGYGLFETDGEWICSIDTSLSNSPITRYRFAESISQSFELDSSLEARNIYAEIGGDGREFIAGGGYNESILSEYGNYIADLEEIPEESRTDVLKAYYNGIFMGDENALFHPQNNLTRAEMAKVLATICNFSLRDRLISDGYARALSEDDVFTDKSGAEYLSFDAWRKVLEEQALNVTSDGETVEFCDGYRAPMGYAIDTYLYGTGENGSYHKLCESTLDSYSDGEFSAQINCGKVIMVLRNLNENGRVDGALSISIQDGEILEAMPTIREM